ncbi:hypothetical protein APHAL10511_000965 [Amanita phalloides]|nr:hypothetical protein APHAL10511_000965 [Amanita phalloides]
MRPSLCFFILSLAAYTLATRRFSPRSPLSELSQYNDKLFTNAMRLSMGYPLKRPHRRSNIRERATDFATRQSSSDASNSTTSGYLEVLDSGHRLLGHISNKYNKYGEYGVLTNNSADRLVVSLQTDHASPHHAVISTINGALAAYPFFGVISGFGSTSGDLKEGHYDYAVFGGTVQRPANFPPTHGKNSFTHFTGIRKSIETAVFAYNPSSNEVTCHWINNDGSRPKTYIGFNGQEATLFITGDKDAFSHKYGSNSIHWVTLNLIPIHSLDSFAQTSQ